MKKETYAAIVLGIVLGLTAAVVMIVKTKESKISKNTPFPSVAPLETPVAPIKSSNLQSFDIAEPENNVVVNKNSITIKGKAPKNALIIIQSPIKDISFSSENEEFSQEIPLAFGENVIHITVYSKDREVNSREKELKVYYLDEQ